ncbi:MAG: L-serine ammonia-lyase, iron-sulfur-dependent, subunit alpha [Candidatus Korarchaeota archaeon]
MVSINSDDAMKSQSGSGDSPQDLPFFSFADLEKYCESQKIPLHEAFIRMEEKVCGLPRPTILQKMKEKLNVMYASMLTVLENPPTLIIKELSAQAARLFSAPPVFLSPLLKKAVARAMAVIENNASMGRICAAPTAGASGIVPAVIITGAEMLNKTDEDILNALFVAGGFGVLMSKTIQFSGAWGGCQAETGVATAMSAAALVSMSGGSPKMATTAAAISLKNILGLVCDPVAGLVISPCIKRNALGVVNSFLSAELALAGVVSLIPLDEVLQALSSVANLMPPMLKERAEAGLATTPTGIRVKSIIDALPWENAFPFFQSQSDHSDFKQ